MTAPTTNSDPQAPRYGLRMTRADEGSEAVVRLHGELELATATLAREEVMRLLATDCERIVVDLRALDFLDSSGIQMLVEAHERCRARGRPMTLLLTPGPVHRTLDVCGLLDVLDHATPEAMAA